ncbi:MAG: thiol:disulfide interchange protein DsbA/DsbL [Oceanococcaceae bacterium]
MMRLTALLLFALSAACTAAESTPAFQAEQHYKSARTEFPDPNPSQPDVVEVFWYGCPHCADFDPLLESWLKTKPDDVNFRRVPTALGRDIGKLHAKAYYTAELLGVLDTVHHAIFQAMHRDRKRLASQAEIEQVFVANGVSTEDFRGTFNSFAVESKVSQGEALIRALGIPAVPAMAVDNRYWTSGREGGGFGGMLKVVDFLIEDSRKR